MRIRPGKHLTLGVIFIFFSIDLVWNVCLHLQFERTRFCQWQVKQFVLNTTTYGTYAHSHKALLVAGEGFEPSKAEPGDLQSPPIGRSGNPPRLLSVSEV